jgi:GT2 family glycosyltransferase
MQRDEMLPLITIVIPCFNHAHYLPDAIESALAQTHAPVEVVVVDDGSTDNTGEVAARYPAAKYVRQVNQGLSAARNAGLKVSTGEFVAFLDADDLLYSDAMATGLCCFVQNPDCAFVYGGYASVTDDRQLVWTRYPRASHASYKGLLRGNRIAMIATVLFRRAILSAVSGFDEALRCCEDYDVYLKLSRVAPIAIHGNLVAQYRRHNANMSSNAGRMLDTSLAVLRSQTIYIKSSHLCRLAMFQGVVYFQRYYGFELIKQAMSELVTEDKGTQSVISLGKILRNAPWALTVPMTRGAQSVLHRLKRGLLGEAAVSSPRNNREVSKRLANPKS